MTGKRVRVTFMRLIWKEHFGGSTGAFKVTEKCHCGVMTQNASAANRMRVSPHAARFLM